MGKYSHRVYILFSDEKVLTTSYNNFFQGNSNKTILVASYFPACQFQFMRTKKKFIHYNKRTHFLSRRTLQLCPTFHSAQSTPYCLTDIHSISEESKDNNTISCVFSLNALVYFSKNNRRMINRERKEKGRHMLNLVRNSNKQAVW